MIKFWAGATACLVGLCAGYGLASRNSSGTMSAINGPYTAGTVISSSVINARLADIETELTDSKSRSGKGDFSSPARTADGTVTAPAFAFTSETGTGLYRIGSSDLGLSINQTKTGEWTANGYQTANGAVATPSLSFFNDTGSGLYRIGSNDIGFAINGTKKLEWTASLFTVTPNTTISGVASLGGALPTTSNTTPFSVIGAGPLFGVESRSGVNTRLASNEYFDGATDKYNANGFAGILQLAGLTSADYVFYTAPSGTAGNTPTFTARMTVNESGVTIGASGTAVAALNVGTCTLNNASPSQCTATVASGAKCVATVVGVVTVPDSTMVSVTGTTLTVTHSNTKTNVVNYVCF